MVQQPTIRSAAQEAVATILDKAPTAHQGVQAAKASPDKSQTRARGPQIAVISPQNAILRPLPFNEPLLYRQARHRVYAGWFKAFSPTMTVSHLLFAVGTTVYILFAIPIEERDLEDSLRGQREYQKRVPMLIPRWSRKD